MLHSDNGRGVLKSVNYLSGRSSEVMCERNKCSDARVKHMCITARVVVSNLIIVLMLDKSWSVVRGLSLIETW